MPTDTRSYSAFGLRILTLTILILVFYGTFSPLNFHPYLPGLEPSWQAALAYSLERGFDFGTDTVFTGGPLSSLYTRQFSQVSAYPIEILSLVIVFFIATAWLRLLDTHMSLGRLVLVYLTLWLMVAPRDTVLLLVPLLTGLHGLNKTPAAKPMITRAGAFLSGVIILAKFSVFPIAIIAMLVLDVTAVAKKRLPLHLLICVAGLCGGFVACGQPLSQIPAFLKASLDVSSGYSSAMSSKGSFTELLAWLAIAAGFTGTLLVTIWKNRHEHGLGLPLARFIVLSAYIFVSFKAGLVRHDLHSLVAWSALGLAILLASHALYDMPKAIARLFAVLAVLLVIPGNALFYFESHRLPFNSISNLPARTLQDLEGMARFVFQPSLWLDNLKKLNDASMAEMRTQAALPPLTGTVDIINSMQSNVIASGLSYRPRPTIQEYTTYSPKLVARNRAFFMGDAAPEYLIMQPGSIDGRHPASAEGALWPLFFARYEAVQSSSLGLILKKRQLPLTDVLDNTIENAARFDEEVAFPDAEKAWMVSIDIKPTILGRLIDILYRPPMSEITVNYLDGTSGHYRLIPAMAGDGMLLSPYVGTELDYLKVSSGHTEFPGLQHAKSFTVQTGLGAGIFYKATFNVRFSPLNATTLRNHGNEFTQNTLERSARAVPLLANNKMREPNISVSVEGVFAHAPATLDLPVKPGAELTAYFGMRDGSWTDGGQTDGVCFSLRSVSGKLAERCLDPVHNANDRGEQTLKITIPQDTTKIQMDTSCRASCVWDWSYWGGIDEEVAQ